MIIILQQNNFHSISVLGIHKYPGVISVNTNLPVFFLCALGVQPDTMHAASAKASMCVFWLSNVHASISDPRQSAFLPNTFLICEMRTFDQASAIFTRILIIKAPVNFIKIKTRISVWKLSAVRS